MLISRTSPAIDRSVSRLDVYTSGCVVVPLCRPVELGLTAAFRRRAVTKRYLALVYGAEPDPNPNPDPNPSLRREPSAVRVNLTVNAKPYQVRRCAYARRDRAASAPRPELFYIQGLRPPARQARYHEVLTACAVPVATSQCADL